MRTQSKSREQWALALAAPLMWVVGTSGQAPVTHTKPSPFHPAPTHPWLPTWNTALGHYRINSGLPANWNSVLEFEMEKKGNSVPFLDLQQSIIGFQCLEPPSFFSEAKLIIKNKDKFKFAFVKCAHLGFSCNIYILIDF